MATMVGTQSDLSSFLKELIELEYDAVEAYRTALDRLTDRDNQRQINTFLADHQRHVSELTGFMRSMGESPPDGGDIKQVLTKGKVFLGSIFGDRAILMAMKTNEDDTNTAYERAVGRTDLTMQLRNIMEKHLADERRHRDWIEMRVSSSERTSSSMR